MGTGPGVPHVTSVSTWGLPIYWRGLWASLIINHAFHFREEALWLAAPQSQFKGTSVAWRLERRQRTGCFLLSWRDGLRQEARKNKPLPPSCPPPGSFTLNQTR